MPCSLSCGFIRTLRSDCERDPCLADNNNCVSSTSSFIGDSTSCFDWCCTVDHTKAIALAVGGGVALLLCLCFSFFGFRRYMRWKHHRDDLAAEQHAAPPLGAVGVTLEEPHPNHSDSIKHLRGVVQNNVALSSTPNGSSANRLSNSESQQGPQAIGTSREHKGSFLSCWRKKEVSAVPVACDTSRQ